MSSQHEDHESREAVSGPRRFRGDLPAEIEALSHRIIGCAIEVHRHLGPGLLESIYEQALVHELVLGGIKVQRQVEMSLSYKGITLVGQRIDVLVEGIVVIELKSLERVLPVHKAQLLSYVRAAGLPLGILINFNVLQLKDGLSRVINERWNPQPTPSSSSRSSR